MKASAMATHWFGEPDGGFQHIVWHKAYSEEWDLWQTLAELDGVEGEFAASSAMTLAWGFARTCQETIRFNIGGRETRYEVVGQPQFVYLEEGEGTGFRLDSADMGPDKFDGRLIALLVLRAPDNGGMMNLWVRKDDGVERLRSVRPTPGMVVAYRPGAMLWEAGEVIEGRLVAIKVVLEGKNVV